MIKLSAIPLALLLFVGLAATTIVSSSQNAQGRLDDATPVQEGMKNNKEKLNGKLFDRHKTGRKVSELKATGPQEVVIKSIVYPPFMKPVANCLAYPDQILTSYAHQADAVVISSVQSKAYSQLTENNDFVFSSYNVIVEEVLKAGPSATIRPNSIIAVLRPGGRVQLNGQVVNAVAGGFRPFAENERYLFFLKYIPETDSYLAFGSGSFLLRDNKALGLSDEVPVRESATSFLTEVRAAVAASPCAHFPLY